MKFRLGSNPLLQNCLRLQGDGIGRFLIVREWSGEQLQIALVLTGWKGVGWVGSVDLKHLQCCLKVFIDSKIGGKVGWGVLIFKYLQ